MSTKGKQLSTTTRRKISVLKTKHTKSHLLKSAKTYFKHLEANPKELPTLSGFCLVAGVHPTNLRDYAIKFPEVDQVAQTIALLQEHYCLTNGITNKANPIFSMFLLKAKHNFKDSPQKLEQNNYISGITPELMADALQLMRENDKKSIDK